MKTPTTDLFDLIKSLSKNEKGYFKKYSKLHVIGENNTYILLFDAIDNQKEYDEPALIRQFKGYSFAKNFAVLKNYLYQLILNRIATLHSNNRTQLRLLLTQADILSNKGLYSQHAKLLKKAKTQAHRYDLSDYLLEISGMEHTLAWRNLQMEDAEKAMKEKKEIISTHEIERKYQQLANEILTRLVKIGNTRNPSDLRELKKLIGNPLMRNEKKAITFRCKNWMYHTLSQYHVIMGNTQKQYFFAKKNINLFSVQPEKIEHFTLIYLFALHNMVNACNGVKKYDEAKSYIESLSKKSLLLNSEREKISAFITFHENNLDYYIKTGQFAEGVGAAEQFAQEITKYAYKLDATHNVIFYFYIAIIYFGAQKYGKCIEWMNKIRDEEHMLRIRPDLEVKAKIFYLIAHFEKGNSDLLPYLTKSLYRYLSTKKRLYKFEDVFLKFLGNHVFKINSRKELVEKFAGLRKEFIALENDASEETTLNEFDYISWLESKIENKTFAEVVRKKSNK